MKPHRSHWLLRLAAGLCLWTAGCALSHPVDFDFRPPDGSTIFLPAPGSSYPIRVTASPSTRFTPGPNTGYQVIASLSDNGREIYRTPLAEAAREYSGFPGLYVPWTPTTLGDHLLHLTVTYVVQTYDASGTLQRTNRGQLQDSSRVCVLNNPAYAYAGLQIGSHDYCSSLLWLLFGRLFPGDHPAPAPPPPPATSTPAAIVLTPHVVQPLPTDTSTARPTATATSTLTPTAIVCPKGTVLIPSLGACYFATRTPKPKPPASLVCSAISSQAVCLASGCSWVKGLCH